MEALQILLLLFGIVALLFLMIGGFIWLVTNFWLTFVILYGLCFGIIGLHMLIDKDTNK